MVLGFILFWPVGLALLAYMIWSKRMFSGNCGSSRQNGKSSFRAATRSSGNMAFDAYKTETLRRLEEEQASFEAFLERLRGAKDKAEFDQFMDDRARDARSDTEGSASRMDDRGQARPDPPARRGPCKGPRRFPHLTERMGTDVRSDFQHLRHTPA